MEYGETKIVSFDDDVIDFKALHDVAEGLKQGKVVVFPTDTIYGMGVLATKKHAIERIYEIKSRSFSKPLTRYVNAVDALTSGEYIVPAFGNDLIASFLPGPLTVILSKKDGTRQGVRFCKNNTLNELLSLLPDEFIGTSANRSGEVVCRSAQEVYAQLKNCVDFIVDTGACKGGVESTVLDMGTDSCVFMRKGALYTDVRVYLESKNIPYKAIKKILVVCTGNTCRSPMVEGILKLRLHQDNLDRYYIIESCGVYAPFQMTASQDAISVMQQEGVDISMHKSRSMTKKLLDEADKIIVMTREHEFAVIDMAPAAASKICILDITDPVGCGRAFYVETCKIIKKKMEEIYPWIKE